MALDDYLSPHFRLSEFASHDGSPFSPSALENLRKQAQLLELIRARAGNRPIRITSGYRSPAHNTAVGGATHSQHPLGTATDMNISGMSPRQTTDLITSMIANGELPSGGLGVYDGWVHYDHRPGNARWAEDGGPKPAYASRATTVDDILGGGTPAEALGAASPAFDSEAQFTPVSGLGSLPTPRVATQSEMAPDFEPATRDMGVQATQALMSDILKNAGSFNYADQLAKRDQFSRQIIDAYGKDQQMTLGDIPGAIIGAPFNILRNALAPVRRALGNQSQLREDALGGATGDALLAAATGDPSILQKAQETPGAGAWLQSLVTDQQERKAAAARQAIAALGLYDKRMGREADVFLTQAQTAAQKAAALSSASEALSRLGSSYYKRFEVNSGTNAQNAAAENSIAAANKADMERALAPGLAQSTMGENNAQARAANALAAGREAELPFIPKEAAGRVGLLEAQTRAAEAAGGLADTRAADINLRRPLVLGKIASEIDKIGAGRDQILAETDNIIQQGDVIRGQVDLLKSKNMLNQEQIDVMEKTGDLMDAKEARAWLDIQGAALKQIQDVQMSGLQEAEAQARINDITTRTDAAKALMAARAVKLPGELGVLQAQIGALNARARNIGNGLGVRSGNPALADEYRRAIIQNVTARTQVVRQGAVMTENQRAQLGLERDKRISEINQAIKQGNIPTDPDGAAIAQERLNQIGASDTWEARYTDRWGPFNRLDIVPRSDRQVAVPTGNIGGANNQQSSTLTETEAAHRNSGGFDDNAYATFAELDAAVRAGQVPREVARGIAERRGWSIPNSGN